MTNYLPEIHQATLGNGLNLLAVEYGRVPWLSLAFMNKRGSETDPPGKAGVADWAAEFLTLGTARRSQLQLANDIDALGASFSARADWDATYVHLEGLAEDFPTLMATLAEVVQTPAFPPEEFPLLKERRRAELTQLLDDPREVASRRFHRLFFGDAPTGSSDGAVSRIDPYIVWPSVIPAALTETVTAAPPVPLPGVTVSHDWSAVSVHGDPSTGTVTFIGRAAASNAPDDGAVARKLRLVTSTPSPVTDKVTEGETIDSSASTTSRAILSPVHPRRDGPHDQNVATRDGICRRRHLCPGAAAVQRLLPFDGRRRSS